MRKPFTILTWLASKSVPGDAKNDEDSTAGFVFFETLDGFNFKSIDSLVTQEQSEYEYFFTFFNNKLTYDKILNFYISNYKKVRVMLEDIFH